jgi:16S rRNA (cytosine967-C5)-methyltransferase
MAIAPARIAAFDVLLRVDQTQAYASELLHAQRYQNLAPADHALLLEIVLGVLRWRSVLDATIAEHSSQKLAKLDLEVLTALRLAAYQLGYLDRVPAYAAISESVDLVKRARKRSAANFVNAVLRRISGAKRPSAADIGSRLPEAAAALAHPEWLVERWAKEFGAEAATAICRYDQERPQVAIHLRDSAVEKELLQGGVQLRPGNLLHHSRRVLAGDVTRTPAFHEGRVVVQDEASQLVATLVGGGRRILDCCAAPGGKTSLIAETYPDARVIAAELHPHRARLLRRLVLKTNVDVIAADCTQPGWQAAFDSALADVPCSGTGTLARNPEIKWRLTLGDLADLRRRQAGILRAALEQVAPGGTVVYSTCSLEREENEEVVQEALSRFPGAALVPCGQRLQELRQQGVLAWTDLDALTRGPFLRTVPGVHPCDGFFAAIIRVS